MKSVPIYVYCLVSFEDLNDVGEKVDTLQLQDKVSFTNLK